MRRKYRNPFFNYEPPPNLPNAMITLILGIASIVLSFFYGIPGFICGLIGVRLSSKDEEKYRFVSAGTYSEESVIQSKNGQLCCFIGIVLSVTIAGLIGSLLVMYGTINFADLQQLKQSK